MYTISFSLRLRRNSTWLHSTNPAIFQIFLYFFLCYHESPWKFLWLENIERPLVHNVTTLHKYLPPISVLSIYFPNCSSHPLSHPSLRTTHNSIVLLPNTQFVQVPGMWNCKQFVVQLDMLNPSAKCEERTGSTKSFRGLKASSS